jgi:hypothetical protein
MKATKSTDMPGAKKWQLRSTLSMNALYKTNAHCSDAELGEKILSYIQVNVV